MVNCLLKQDQVTGGGGFWAKIRLLLFEIEERVGQFFGEPSVGSLAIHATKFFLLTGNVLICRVIERRSFL